MAETLLQLSKNSDTFKELFLQILCNLSYKNYQTIGQVDPIFNFLAVLFSNTADSTKQNTAVILGNLALNETHCQIIGEVDGIFNSLTELLSNDSDSVKSKAAYALGNLALNEINRVKIGQVDRIFHTLTEPSNDSDSVKTMRCCIGNLAINHKNSVDIAQVDRILDLLTNLLNINDSILIKENAAHVLSKLAFHIEINEENTPQIRNMAETLLQLSQNSNPFKEIFVQILCNLSYKNHQTIGQVDHVFDFLSFLLSSPSDSIKASALTLGNLALNQTYAKDRPN